MLPSTSSRTVTWKNNHITRAHTLLYKSFNIDQDKQDSNKFISSSQTNFSSETPSNIQCIKRHQSFQHLQSTEMNSNDLDQTIKYSSNLMLTSDDEDDEDILSNVKTFMDQASQAVFEDRKKPKKKRKKSKSRTKQTNGLQIPPSTLSLSSQNRINSNGDLTTLTSPMKASTSMAKYEETNGVKSIITVDTSKARSNLEVVRLCVRELGWKEVHSLCLIENYYTCFFSLHIIQLLIQIFIGIHHHFMRVIQTLHLILVELINFLVIKKPQRFLQISLF